MMSKPKGFYADRASGCNRSHCLTDDNTDTDTNLGKGRCQTFSVSTRLFGHLKKISLSLNVCCALRLKRAYYKTCTFTIARGALEVNHYEQTARFYIN